MVDYLLGLLLALIGIGVLDRAVRAFRPRTTRLLAPSVGGFVIIVSGLVWLLNLPLFRNSFRLGLVVTVSIAMLGIALLAFGAWKKWGDYRDSSEADLGAEVSANLAIALGFGAGVAFVVLALQTVVQILGYNQGIDSQREAIKLSIATAPDLSGFIVPRDPDDQDSPEYGWVLVPWEEDGTELAGGSHID